MAGTSEISIMATLHSTVDLSDPELFWLSNRMHVCFETTQTTCALRKLCLLGSVLVRLAGLQILLKSVGRYPGGCPEVPCAHLPQEVYCVFLARSIPLDRVASS